MLFVYLSHVAINDKSMTIIESKLNIKKIFPFTREKIYRKRITTLQQQVFFLLHSDPLLTETFRRKSEDIDMHLVYK